MEPETAAPARGSPDVEPPSRAVNRRAVAAILFVSLALRLPNLTAPIIERHDFRQTQTAITVQAWLDRGFTLLDYETPVFGPPWKVPLEFPTYQATVYPLARAGVPLDLASRIAALAWFYASALLLLALTRRFTGAVAAVAALGVYVLSPFSIVWSRACSIDYASVALALGWTLALARWSERPRVATALGATALGTLAALTKITTIAGFLPSVAVLSLALLGRSRREGARALVARAAELASMLAIPLAVAVAWTRWADHVKAASPATAWLVSARLVQWNFGSLAQRLSASAWWQVLQRIGWIVPGLFAAALPFGLAAPFRRRGSERFVVPAALAGVAASILTFFNLYWVHDYYLIGVTPGLAVVAGAGLAELASLTFRRRSIVLAAAAAVALATALPAYQYVHSAWKNTRNSDVMRVARAVAAATPPDRWIVVAGDDWNPRIPYLSHRRGVMIRPPFVGPEIAASRPEVATLVCRPCPPGVLAAWPRRVLVASVASTDVYHVVGEGEPPAAPAEPPAGRTGPGRPGGSSSTLRGEIP